MSRDPQTIWRDGEPDDVAGMDIFGVREGGTNCPSPEMIRAVATDTLPPDLEAALTAHIAKCEICRTLRPSLDDPSLSDLNAEARDRILRRVRAAVVGRLVTDLRARRRARRLFALRVFAVVRGGLRRG